MHIDRRDYLALAGRLRARRVEAGLTQVELADRLGVPQSFVSKCETGERRLDVLELRHVCTHLNTSLTAFVRALESSLTGSV